MAAGEAVSDRGAFLKLLAEGDGAADAQVCAAAARRSPVIVLTSSRHAHGTLETLLTTAHDAAHEKHAHEKHAHGLTRR